MSTELKSERLEGDGMTKRAQQEAAAILSEYGRPSDADEPDAEIIYDYDWRDYREDERLNVSALKEARHCMARVKHALDGGSSDSAALRFGTACHVSILEPAFFDAEWTIAGNCEAPIASGARAGQPCGKSAKGQVAGEWRCGTHSKGEQLFTPTYMVTQSDLEKINGIKASLRGDEIMEMLNHQGGCEATTHWSHDGVLMKSRLDKLILKKGIRPTILDIKTAQDLGASESGFKRAIKKYAYHVQAAAYVQAVRQAEGVTCEWIWLVVEKTAPYCVGVYRASPAMLREGWKQFQTWMTLYSQCKAMGAWPSYTNGVHTIDFD